MHGPFGPFSISGGNLAITITDDSDATCTAVATVTAPAECSDCVLNAPVIVATCDDNGTSDPSDDTYTFTIQVDETSGLGVSYALSGDVAATGLSYGVVEGPFGPYPVSGGSLVVTITDESDAACQLINQTVTAPATCSPSCNLAPIIVVTCDDNGTTDPSDDTFTYTFDVPNTPASGASYSITGGRFTANAGL